jgi:hypothetical protein
MKRNWILTEARKANAGADRIILENPSTRIYLDDLLMKRFWPTIWSCLEGSSYPYEPQLDPEMESEWICGEAARSLTFALFDEGKIFFRGKLSCSKESWMIKSEHFLSLIKETELEVLRELLGNTRLCGNPPTLIVDKRNEGDFFQIHFNAGYGESWGAMSENEVEERIKQVIRTNIEMYEQSIDGWIGIQDVGSFLTLAYHAYEAF